MTQTSREPLLHKLIRELLNFLFNLLYNQLSWAYDLVAWVVSAGLWKSWVLSLLPYLKEGKILELGYGPGHLQLEGLRLKKKMFGIDISPSMVKICSRRLTAANFSPNILRANALQLPFASESFEQIAATFPAAYIFTPQALTEINRTLKPGGELLIIPTALPSSKSIIQKLLAWLLIISGKTNNRDENPLERILQNFNAHGFDATHLELEIKKSKVLLIKATKIG